MHVINDSTIYSSTITWHFSLGLNIEAIELFGDVGIWKNREWISHEFTWFIIYLSIDLSIYLPIYLSIYGNRQNYEKKNVQLRQAAPASDFSIIGFFPIRVQNIPEVIRTFFFP